jgi:hypothetical protein
MGIGISKGANLILRYAALHKCEFKAIVSIANPYNLYVFNHIYGRPVPRT